VSGIRLRKWVGWGLVVAMSGFPAKAKVAPKSPVVVTISVYNDAAVPWGTIRGAEDEASQIFREAGIDVEWLNCHAVSDITVAAEKSRGCGETIFPEHLDLRIVRRSVGLSPKVMGISFLSEDGSGCQADLFYERIEGLRQKSNASLTSILGVWPHTKSGTCCLERIRMLPAELCARSGDTMSSSASAGGRCFFRRKNPRG